MPVKGPYEFFGEFETEHAASRDIFKGTRGEARKCCLIAFVSSAEQKGE